jgi:hypothetical protein
MEVLGREAFNLGIQTAHFTCIESVQINFQEVQLIIRNNDLLYIWIQQYYN